MLTDRSKNNIERAHELLEEAQNEMFKAEEDLVAMKVCHNARQSINKYLEAFLLHHGVEPTSDDNELLLEQCKKIEPRFHTISAGDHQCKQGEFCTDINRLENCLAFAKNIRNVVIDGNTGTWPLSKHVK
jgi:hypothetical protein